MLLRPLPIRRARVLFAAFIFSLLLVGFWYYRGGVPAFQAIRSGDLPLPPEYRSGAQDAQESAFCRDRFGPKFLHDLRSHAVAYCSPGSSSALTCFHTHNHPDGRVDSLCIGQSVTLNADTGRFQLGCQVRTLGDNETAAGLIGLNQLTSYWYDTGPGIIFREYVDTTTTTTAAAAAPSDVATVVGAGDPAPPPRYTLLLKREGEGNLWHCLMEIMTMTLTLDVLRMSRAPAGPPFFAVPDSVPDTQVIILDDRPDGPYFDLWRLFAGRAPVRLRDVLRDPATARAWAAAPPQTLVVPLAGAANPLWQNDWTDRDCRTAPLLRVFAQRVLAHYGVAGSSSSSTAAAEDDDGAWTLAEGTEEDGERKPAGQQRRLRLTLIDRAASRRLAHGAALLRAVRRRFPDGAGDDVVVQAVDFAALSFADQLRMARTTDVLVGVHGAGLTHALFLRPGAGAVVEVAPPGLNHKGFRNLARMRGLHYFSLRGAIAGDVAAETTPAAVAAAAPPQDPGDEEEDNARSETRSSRRWRQLGGGDDDDDEDDDALVRRDWHSDDLMVEEQAFVDVVVEAIAALRQGPPGT